MNARHERTVLAAIAGADRALLMDLWRLLPGPCGADWNHDDVLEHYGIVEEIRDLLAREAGRR